MLLIAFYSNLSAKQYYSEMIGFVVRRGKCIRLELCSTSFFFSLLIRVYLLKVLMKLRVPEVFYLRVSPDLWSVSFLLKTCTQAGTCTVRGPLWLL